MATIFLNEFSPYQRAIISVLQIISQKNAAAEAAALDVETCNI
jgi:hypothetical protein